MIRGLYTGWTGMRNEQNRLDVVANNLANVNTTGYKKEGTVSQEFSDVLALKIKDMSEAPFTTRGIGLLNLGVKIGETYINWEQGPFRVTDESLDFALAGNGFFTIEHTNKAVSIQRDQANQTTTMYTRDGNFTMTAAGELVTQDGDYVLDDNGNHIVLDPLQPVSVSRTGQISQNGEVIATLGITDFADYNTLTRYGENYFEPIAGAEQIEADAQVMEGYLEQSNVSAVDEMISLITIQRQYDANATMIRTVDTTIDKSVNNVGRVS